MKRRIPALISHGGPTKIKNPKFEIFKDKQLEWRWRLLSRNGKVIAVSGEGYARPGYCSRSVHRMAEIVRQAKPYMTSIGPRVR